MAETDSLEKSRDSHDLLRESEERYRLLADHAHDIIWTMSPEGVTTYVSPGVEAMRGFTPEEAMNQSIEEMHPPQSTELCLDYFGQIQARVKEGLAPEAFRCELEYYRKDGSTVWVEVQVVPHLGPEGELIEILGVSRDISERKQFESKLQKAQSDVEDANAELEQANAQLHQQATTDELTGFRNRRHAREILEAAAREVARGRHHSILMIDIDHFKGINDQLGHNGGDQFLIELSQRILEQIREDDVLIRWGGDEFVVFMPLCAKEDAFMVAERIREAVASKPLLDGPVATVSIGVSEALPAESIKHWIGRSDSALYEAKQAGRNSVKYSD